MIARESFEKSWPRFASAAPFLCLIDDHLLCPDMRLLPDERRGTARGRACRSVSSGWNAAARIAPCADEHRVAVELGEHLDVGPASTTAARG